MGLEVASLAGSASLRALNVVAGVLLAAEAALGHLLVATPSVHGDTSAG